MTEQIATHEAWEFYDLSGCPFYRGTGTCNSGCRDEPNCQTGEPMQGWPEVSGPFECDCGDPDGHAEENAEAKRHLAKQQRSQMLARRDELMAVHLEVTQASDFAPLMGDMEPEYWNWCLERYFAGEANSDD